MAEVAKFLRNTPDSRTENGALTFSSSLNAVLDLFAMGGAIRTRSVSDVENMVMKAFKESPELTIKCLCYLRDAREGVGERKTFRIALNRLGREKTANEKVVNFFNSPDKLKGIVEYGRWDDLFSLFGTQYESAMASVVRAQFHEDMKSLEKDNEKAKISLLGKWLPSINASNVETRKLALKIEKILELNHKTYRKDLSSLRKQLGILERAMMAKDYKSVDYSKVPSLAFMKHMNAFKTHDSSKFTLFMDKVKTGEAKVNTSVLMPVDIVHKLVGNDPWGRYSKASSEIEELTVLWDNLPNYLGKDGEQALVIADVSGSMGSCYGGTVQPIEVCLAIAMYYAERNAGPWKDHFMTFSDKPKLTRIAGDNLLQRFKSIATANWDGSTNVEAAFGEILKIAKANNLTQDDMPRKLYIVSDMEFNSCARGTNYQNAKRMFEDAGYTLPTVVFWNVSARNDNLPVRFDESGTALVSGYSATIFKSLVGRYDLSPVGLMMDVLNGPRYKDII